MLLSLNIDVNNSVVYYKKTNKIHWNNFNGSSSFRANVNVITFRITGNYWICFIDKT